MTEGAEVLRGEGDSPGCIKPVAMLETLDEAPLGGEDIDIAKARAVGFERLTLLVESVGDDDIVADGLDVEGDVVAGQEGIGEGFVVIVVVVVEVAAVVILIVGVESYGVKGLHSKLS